MGQADKEKLARSLRGMIISRKTAMEIKTRLILDNDWQDALELMKMVDEATNTSEQLDAMEDTKELYYGLASPDGHANANGMTLADYSKAHGVEIQDFLKNSLADARIMEAMAKAMNDKIAGEKWEEEANKPAIIHLKVPIEVVKASPYKSYEGIVAEAHEKMHGIKMQVNIIRNSYDFENDFMEFQYYVTDPVIKPLTSNKLACSLAEIANQSSQSGL